MASEVGGKLLALLRELQATTAWQIAVTHERVAESTWSLTGATWEAKVRIAPRWLGLEFDAQDPASGRRAHHFTNTDLYDISRPNERDFADEIEREIMDFLDALRKGNVVRRREGSNFVLVFPLNGSYARVARCRFGCTTRTKLAAEPTASDYETVV